jgi:hypothetical protein
MVHASRPTVAAILPAGQSRQTLEAIVGAIVPLEQLAHSLSVLEGAILPFAHALHVAVPAVAE